MERSVLLSPAVTRLIEERYVAVELYTDRGDEIENRHRDLLHSFQGPATSIPVYLLLSPDGKEVRARRVGKRSEDDFLDFLRESEPAG